MGPDNLWARPTCSWRVHRPKPKEGHGPSSKIGSTKGPGDMAEDSLVLGKPKVSLMKVVYEQTLKIKKYLREIVLNTLH